MHSHRPSSLTARVASGYQTGPNRPRTGGMVVLISALLVVLLAMTLFTVDVAYMQLTRSELRAATDAAAKAGAEALRRTKSETQARQAAINVAAQNMVGGRGLLLRADEIDLGRSAPQPDGSWTFQPNLTPFSAVRVRSRLGGGSDNAPVSLFFAGMFGSGAFEPAQTATASHTTHEICLCLDRSHSMCWDLSGIDGRYPSEISSLPNPSSIPPHPTSSRWGVMMGAVQQFLTITQAQAPRPRVGLVTWSSDSAGWGSTGLPVTAASYDVTLTTNHTAILDSLAARSQQPMPGATNMSAGMNMALGAMTDSAAIDPLASRIVVLMSDGLWNRGIDPVITAQSFQQAGIVVHTISFLAAENEAALEQIATITGGRSYSADNQSELEAIFKEIARQLPIVLTE